MKLNEMRALGGADFGREVSARKKELMELRFQGATGQLANSSRVRELRKEIAQLLTVQTEQASSAVALSANPNQLEAGQ